MEMSNENISLLIGRLYNNGDYQTLNIDELFKHTSPDMHPRDAFILEQKLTQTRFIKYRQAMMYSHAVMENALTNTRDISLSDFGIEELNAHKTYIGFLKHQKQQISAKNRKKRWREFLRWAKENTGKTIVAAVGVAATFIITKNCTPTPTQPPPTNQELQHIQEKKDSTAKSP